MAASAHSKQPLSSRHRGLLNLLKLATIGAIALSSLWLVWEHNEWFRDPSQIKLQVMAWGVWAPVCYILLYAIGPSFLLPGAVMTIAAGLAFGTLRGAIYAVAGADLGALVAFGAGRMLGREFVQRVIGDRFQTLLQRIARNGFRIIFYLRLFPVIPYNALNLIAGASPIAFRDYFWASMIGMIPGTILFAFLGNELWHPTSPRFMLAVALIFVCLGAGELYRRFAGDRALSAEVLASDGGAER